MYGYGLKSIMLSMTETICKVTDGNGNMHLIEEVIGWGQELLQKPVTLLEGVKETISSLHGKYKLVLATKGDLFDQKRKIEASGLREYFHHIEIMSDKKIDDYQRLIDTLGCPPEKLLMIGNSVKSDILPVLELGGYAAHVPYHVTWAYEQHEGEIRHPNFIIADIFNHLVYAFHLGNRNFTIFYITAYKITQCTAEIFMARIGEEGTGIGQHTNKSAQ